MKRREFLQLPVVSTLPPAVATSVAPAEARSGSWLPEAALLSLREALGERLIRPVLPWAGLRSGQQVPSDLQNPWYLLDQPGGTQSTGMSGAWSSRASDWAVRANDTASLDASPEGMPPEWLQLFLASLSAWLQSACRSG